MVRPGPIEPVRSASLGSLGVPSAHQYVANGIPLPLRLIFDNTR